jgi:hypothetical protein
VRKGESFVSRRWRKLGCLPSPKSYGTERRQRGIRQASEQAYEPKLLVGAGGDGGKLELKEMALARVEVDGMDALRLGRDGVVERVVSRTETRRVSKLYIELGRLQWRTW